MGQYIGDYIHFNQKNYNIYGINRVNETPSENWSGAVANLKNQFDISSQITDLMNQAKELEDAYNNLYYGNGDSDAQSVKFRNAMQQAAQEMLNEHFGLMAGRFNPDTVGVDSTPHYQQLRNAIKKTRTNIQKIALFKENESNNVINNKLIQLAKLLDEDAFKNLNFAQTRLQEAKNIVKTLQQEINKQSGVSISASDIETLNKIINEFNRDPLLYNQAGDLFEWVLPLISLKACNLGKNELVNEMKKIAKESNVGNLNFTIEMPDLLKSEDLELDILENNISIKSESVRNKTDVVINYSNKNGKDLQIPVSAKSISGRHIKLVEATTLYRVFMLSQNYQFATHYLNVITLSSGEGRNNNSQILEANRLAKALALKMGAEGYDINNPSEVLIVNNRKEKHIYVYNLKALVYLITNKMINEGKYTGIIKGLQDNFTINQKFDKQSANNRIGKIVNTLNQIKITGSLSGPQLDSYLSLLNH